MKRSLGIFFLFIISIFLFSRVVSAGPNGKCGVNYQCGGQFHCCDTEGYVDAGGAYPDCFPKGTPCPGDDGNDNGDGNPTCPTGMVTNGKCEAGLRPITVANCCKAAEGTCTPACTANQICDATNKCVDKPPICTPACKVDEVCNAEKKCVVDPKCAAVKFVKASVAPSTVRPFDQVTVRCNYGKKLDCLSVTGAGLKNCRYSRYEGTDNIFSCDAGPSAGFYDDAKCIQSSTGSCCASTDKAGDMTIIGTDVHYDQDIVLPFGTYTLSARVFSVISKGKGVRVSLICNSDTCIAGKAKNAEIAAITFPETPDFVSKSLSVPLKGTGDDRHYFIRVNADKGSEAYFDSVSLKNNTAPSRELVVNNEFEGITNGSIATMQPVSWGEGDNKIGYYYGSVAEDQGGSPEPTGSSPPGGPTPTPGKPSTVSLALKIKLQGVTKKPVKSDPIKVQVKLGGGSLKDTTAPKVVEFTVNDAGEWSGKADFENISSGGGYKIYIKGPKHIQKKICDAAPKEDKGGTYHCGEGAITIAAGTNTFDLSKIINLAGDLPEAGGKQNGIVDAYDTTFVRTNLGSTDAAKVAIGDLNYDGIIDTQDYSMILQALSIKFDEE